jgi:hypothetical protein
MRGLASESCGLRSADRVFAEPPRCGAEGGRWSSRWMAARGTMGLRCSGRANHRDPVRPLHLPGDEIHKLHHPLAGFKTHPASEDAG